MVGSRKCMFMLITAQCSDRAALFYSKILSDWVYDILYICWGSQNISKLVQNFHEKISFQFEQVFFLIQSLIMKFRYLITSLQNFNSILHPDSFKTQNFRKSDPWTFCATFKKNTGRLESKSLVHMTLQTTWMLLACWYYK